MGARLDTNDITPNNLGQLRVLQRTAGWESSDKFCADALESGELSKFAMFNDMPVGAITCRRVEDAPPGFAKLSKREQQLAMRYRVQVVGIYVLPAYRRLGLGKLLARTLVDVATADKKILSVSVSLDVAVGEDERTATRRVFEDCGFTLTPEGSSLEIDVASA